MQITPKVLSIPPYLSTTWDNIAALKPEPSGGAYTLTITLKTGDQVLIPSLAESEVNSILEAHAQFLSPAQPVVPMQNLKFPLPFSFNLPFKQEGPFSFLGESMHHNPEQSDLPEIPQEILGKVAIIAKAFGFDDFSTLPEAENNCNCIYCQLKRAFSPTANLEEKIKDEDLIFRDWEVKEVSENLYTVTSPLDKNEQYSVFLGQPLGCTCGQKNCEHIKAVLHS
jgi:hypothetical protein